MGEQDSVAGEDRTEHGNRARVGGAPCRIQDHAEHCRRDDQ
ncbi:hypothetical protein Q2K19_31620 [Micromonospora soli]|nr:hypothetical protein [Micromonospora sp. NBRC 110009]WKT98643.1 hypothetical protein Q2K19_31620 [Micromonospora sp. NBRC 110009]